MGRGGRKWRGDGAMGRERENGREGEIDRQGAKEKGWEGEEGGRKMGTGWEGK